MFSSTEFHFCIDHHFEHYCIENIFLTCFLSLRTQCACYTECILRLNLFSDARLVFQTRRLFQHKTLKCPLDPFMIQLLQHVKASIIFKVVLLHYKSTKLSQLFMQIVIINHYQIIRTVYVAKVFESSFLH